MNILKEYIKKYINEGKISLSSTSLDDQIDALLINFEQSATEDQEFQVKYEGFFTKYAKEILKEAEEDEDKEPDKNEKPAEDATTDNSDIDVKKPAEPEKPKINISEFAENVSRLIRNYQNLLDPKTVIFMRSFNFIEKNYGFPSAVKFEEILSKEHDIDLEKENRPKNKAPYAIGAGPEV